MGLFDFLKKDRQPGPPPPPHLTLANLRPGYLVDYDLKTWEVKAHHTYQWGEEGETREWQLANGDEIFYLELESGDEPDWSWNRKISFKSLGPEVKRAILDNGDPPDEIVFQGITYYLEDMAGGHFLAGGIGPGRELLRWGYEDEQSENYLGIEQWGEEEFEASQGKPVHEYQFTNILPRETAQS